MSLITLRSSISNGWRFMGHEVTRYMAQRNTKQLTYSLIREPLTSPFSALARVQRLKREQIVVPNHSQHASAQPPLFRWQAAGQPMIPGRGFLPSIWYPKLSSAFQRAFYCSSSTEAPLSEIEQASLKIEEFQALTVSDLNLARKGLSELLHFPNPYIQTKAIQALAPLLDLKAHRLGSF